MSGNRPREIKLLCPSLSKVANLVAWDEQKIDLGSIARAFGLDPSTLRLNGHFISRGVDLISSSVTWKSLLSFFSAKGLSTGKDSHDALVVTGKLCKVGNKRGHDSQDFQNGIGKVVLVEGGNACSSRGTQLEDMNLHKNKKLRESNSGAMQVCKHLKTFDDKFRKHFAILQSSFWRTSVLLCEGIFAFLFNYYCFSFCIFFSKGEILNGLSCKRKQLLEDVNLFKKLKINGDKSDIQDKVDDLSGRISRSQFTCSQTSKNLKRIREDETIVAAHCKRIR